MSQTNTQQSGAGDPVAAWPRWAGAVSLVLSGAVLLLSILVCALGVAEGMRSGLVEAWFASAFAVVMATGGALGVLMGLGKIRGAEPLTLLCIGGMAFVGSVLSDPSLALRAMGRGGSSPVFAGVNMQWPVLGLLVLGLLLIGLSAVTTLRRDPRRSIPLVGRGIAFGVPVAAIGAAWMLPASRRMILTMPGWALTLAALAAMIALVICVSASLHLLIRGFGVAAHAGGSAPEAPDGGQKPVEGGAGVAQQ